jgi:hypothetical protein
MGIGLLMHTLPYIYNWLRHHRFREFAKAMSLMAMTVCSHHVTPIFGMVFFIFPIIGMAIMDDARQSVESYKAIKISHFWGAFRRLFWRNIKLGISSLSIIILCLLPYWINTKNNPITQVPIPHGSRDSFLEVASSGLVFFLIPWGIFLVLMPYFLYRLYHKRYIFFGLSFTMLVILGTGGTTPIPKMLLGENAFNILTLDRFTLWATIMILPIVGEFTYRYGIGDLKTYFQEKHGQFYHRLSGAGLFVGFIFFALLASTLSYFRPSQPEKIELLPIQNFLSQDEHYRWRYMTLGFGDQMALLAATTKAQSVDGNYHSARRLPELTTRAVERLENAKFRGIEGLGSLEQFLTSPEKYHLRYIFSNDKFYDPMLFFHGWHKLVKLSNGIQVWERSGIKALAQVQHIPYIAQWQKLMWGIIPIGTIILVLLIFLLFHRSDKNDSDQLSYTQLPGSRLLRTQHLWAYLCCIFFIWIIYTTIQSQQTHKSPTLLIKSYYDALDFKRYDDAYEMINKNDGLSKDLYLLQIASQDGLLNSYAKMESINTKVIHQSKNKAIVSADIEWVTALSSIKKNIEHTLVKENGEWYLEADKTDIDITPDQVITRSYPSWLNQGKRELTTAPTKKRDILMQPVVVVTESKLVYKNDQYHVIGEILNVDETPADLSVEAVLYDGNNNVIAKQRDGMVSKHKLLPKEKSLFRIDFNDLSWKIELDTLTNDHSEIIQVLGIEFYIQLAALSRSNVNMRRFAGMEKFGELNKSYENNITKIKLGPYDNQTQVIDVLSSVKAEGYEDAFITYDPNKYPELTLNKLNQIFNTNGIPSTFQINITSNVNTYDLERDLAIADIRNIGNTIELTLLSQGINEITIPQLLTGYYENEELIWVEDDYGLKSIKPIKKAEVNHEIINDKINILSTEAKHIYINSFPNQTYLNKYQPDLELNDFYYRTESNGTKSYKFQLNNFIGNK